jgi:putative glutamine amidotransferase
VKNLILSSKLINDEHKSLGVFIDFDLINYFKKLNYNLIFYPDIKKLNKIKFHGIVLSGGNDLSIIKKNNINKIRDDYENKLLDYALRNSKKILGICRGFQFINTYFGEKLKKSVSREKYHNIIFTKKIFKIKMNDKICVNSFHNYKIYKTSDNFIDISTEADNSIEIAISKNKKILCTMFHPERFNKSQAKINQIIKSFFK